MSFCTTVVTRLMPSPVKHIERLNLEYSIQQDSQTNLPEKCFKAEWRQDEATVTFWKRRASWMQTEWIQKPLSTLQNDNLSAPELLVNAINETKIHTWIKKKWRKSNIAHKWCTIRYFRWSLLIAIIIEWS